MLKKVLFGVLLTYGAVAAYGENQTAVFAGGCFWCVQTDFDKLPGVVSTKAGYDGGTKPNPTYHSVSDGGTNYAESVEVVFDPSKMTYAQVVNYFLHHIDPTQANGQFCDHGKQYRSAIFYLNGEQEKVAEQAIAAIKPEFAHVYTEVAPSTHFYPAEAYHQDYYKKNPVRYKFYRWNCGRDAQVKSVWAQATADTAVPTDIAKYCNFDKAARLKQLTTLQYDVTQKGDTEKPYSNAYWNNTAPGIYVDIVSGEPLFSSTDKYKSGTGWPSFTKPIEPAFIVTKPDRTWYLAERTEVLSRCGDSHLGHVFDDGPPPTGKRYCMNSAAMRFIPAADLVKEGYGQFVYLFNKQKP